MTYILYIMCHVFGTFLENFDVSFPFIDNLCMIYKSTSIFLRMYIDALSNPLLNPLEGPTM
jgi:hypothetical protein